MAEEKDGSGSLLSRLLRGAGRDVLAQVSPSGRGQLHQDRLGSVTAGTDGTGSPAFARSFAPWGEERSRTGIAPPDVSYTAHQSDPATGLTYMKKRWYDGTVGRFLSEDPAAPSLREPVTANEFLYANGDPVNNTDPTGMWASKYGFTVHQDVIEEMLIRVVPNDDALRRLKEQQYTIDEDQSMVDQYKHAMTGAFNCENLSPRPKMDWGMVARCRNLLDTGDLQQTFEFRRRKDIQDASLWVYNGLSEAVTRYKRIRDAIIAGTLVDPIPTTDWEEVWENLGNAMHTVQDSSSPSHEKFQPWVDQSILPKSIGTSSQSLILELQALHAAKELFASGEHGGRLRRDTREVYNHFCAAVEGKRALQTTYFHAASGDLILYWLPDSDLDNPATTYKIGENSRSFASFEQRYCGLPEMKISNSWPRVYEQ